MGHAVGDSDREASSGSSDGEPLEAGLLGRPSQALSRVAVVGLALTLVGAIYAVCQTGGAGRQRLRDAGRSELAAAPVLAATGPARVEAVPNISVKAIYTFGAPGASNPPLINLMAKDGCFTGVRCYAENILGPVTVAVDAAAISNPMPHAKMATAVLHDGSDSKFVACGEGTDWPNDAKGTEFSEWRLHWQDTYEPRLKAMTVDGADRTAEEPIKTAQMSVLMAYKVYDNTKNAKDDVAASFPSWTLTAQETVVSGQGWGYDEDPVMLFQDSNSFDCMLVIAGINYFMHEGVTALKLWQAGFCGFEGVHTGYRDQLRQLGDKVWPRLKPKLAKCHAVSCSGHSMGGALCELFAACINSRRSGDSDYDKLSWTPEKAPSLNPQIDAGGAIYREGAAVKCASPPCPK